MRIVESQCASIKHILLHTLLFGLHCFLLPCQDVRRMSQGPDGPEMQIDFSPPFKRINMLDELQS